MFIANNLDLLLIEIEKQLSDPNDLAFINKILLFDYLELVNLNVELDKIDLRRRCEKIVSYADLLKRRVISRRVKNVVFGKLFEEANVDKLALDVVREFDLFLIDDEKIVSASIHKMFENNPAAVTEYKNKEKKRLKIFDFFVGRVHNDLNDRADPDLVDRLVLTRLKSLLSSS